MTQYEQRNATVFTRSSRLAVSRVIASTRDPIETEPADFPVVVFDVMTSLDRGFIQNGVFAWFHVFYGPSIIDPSIVDA